MKFHPTLLALAILIPLLTLGQKKLSIEDASGLNRELFPSSLRNLQWIGNTDRFSWQDNTALISRKATSTVPDTILKLKSLNLDLLNSGLDTLTRFPVITWKSDKEFLFNVKANVYRYDLTSKKAVLVNSYPDEAENMDFSPDPGILAYTLNNNLFISSEGIQSKVTNDTIDGIVNGQVVHRNEFGIKKGTYWSPSGKHLAYYRKDETMVTQYPIVNTGERIATVHDIRYPMAGMSSEQVSLMIYHLEDNTHTQIKTDGPPDQYLTSVTWGPDDKDIYVAILNRDQDHLKLNRYDAKTGNLINTLFEERDPEYVEPLFPLYFLESNPELFIWMSERDGFQHLYLYNTEGQLIRQLTKGDWMVTSLAGTNLKGTKAFFLATKNSPLNQDLFSVEINSGKILPLSLKNGTHTTILNKSGKYFIDIFSDTITCREYSIADEKGRVLQVIHTSDDPLRNYSIGKARIFKLKAQDGTDLLCRLILPSGFNPGKKYPVIDYVYGGPHDQLVNNTWLGGASLFLYYLAEQGFIIFTLDNRGSDNRGQEFEQAIFRRLGAREAEDQMTGINYLKQLSYIDTDRIGIHGWSYGGFMTINMMLREPDVFKTGVCGGPVCDWKYYEVMYGERYMDTPEQNPEGYASSSLLDQAANLKGNLLIIHGTSDPVVVWQHSLQMLKRFIEEGKLVDYFVYPGHEHGVGGKDRLHLNRKIEKYFLDNL